MSKYPRSIYLASAIKNQAEAYKHQSEWMSRQVCPVKLGVRKVKYKHRVNVFLSKLTDKEREAFMKTELYRQMCELMKID